MKDGYKFLALVMVIAGFYFGPHDWHQHEQHVIQKNIRNSVDANGFIALPPTNVNPEFVVIGSPPNCPSQEAQRARELARELNERGVRCVLRDSVTFRPRSDHVDADMQRMNSVMQGPGPTVFIHGRGKANPTLDEVLAEYTHEE